MPKPKGSSKPVGSGRQRSEKTGQPVIRVQLSSRQRSELLAIAERSGRKGFTAGVEILFEDWDRVQRSKLLIEFQMSFVKNGRSYEEPILLQDMAAIAEIYPNAWNLVGDSFGISPEDIRSRIERKEIKISEVLSAIED